MSYPIAGPEPHTLQFEQSGVNPNISIIHDNHSFRVQWTAQNLGPDDASADGHPGRGRPEPVTLLRRFAKLLDRQSNPVRPEAVDGVRVTPKHQMLQERSAPGRNKSKPLRLFIATRLKRMKVTFARECSVA
jgi:hypothetical protein